MDYKRQLAQASSEKDLYNILQALNDQHKATSLQLDQAMSSTQLAQDHDIKRLDLLRAQLGTALNSSHEISQMLETASYGASRISSKVRAIDGEKDRVNQALQYVEDVILLRTSVIGCQDAMDSRRWEDAAQFIHKANSLPESLVTSEFTKAMVPTSELPDYPRETISKAAESLVHLFVREFGKAAEVKDMENVTRYFKLFPLIGEETQGLDVYGKFICGIITTHSRTLMQSRTQNSSDSSSSSPMFYAVAATRLFENIATIVAQHAPIVEKHYGKGRMGRVVDRIQNEADSQGGLILDTFWDERRIDRLIEQVRTYPFSYLVSTFSRVRTSEDSAAGYDSVELKHVGDLVGEASVMFHRWTLYKKFLAVRWADFEGASLDQEPSGSVNSDHQHLRAPELIVNSGFARKLTTKLTPAFESMATFVFRRSVEKAFQLEEMPDLHQKASPDSPLVASSVNDIMMVFSSLVKQTLATGDLQLIKTVLSNIRRILESDYIGMVQRKLRDGAPKQLQASSMPITRSSTPPAGSNSSAAGGLTAGTDERLRNFMVHLNSLSVISLYTERVVSSLYYDDLFPDDATVTRDMVSALATSFKSRCNELGADGLRTLFNFILKPKLTGLFTMVTRNADYINVNQQQHQNQVDISDEFALGWDDIMRQFEPVITQDNYTRLISLAAQSLSKSLERWVWSLEGKINELGAIRLDRHVGRIINKASEHYHFREKFVRVAQIVTIVGLDEAEDEQGVAWALDEAEIQRARRLKAVY